MKAPLIIIFSFFLSFGYTQTTNPDCGFYIKGKVVAVLGNIVLTNTKPIIIITGAKREFYELNDDGEFAIMNLYSGTYKFEIISDFGTIDTSLQIENSSIDNLIFKFLSICPKNGDSAIIDIKQNQPKLLIYSEAIYYNQHEFEIKYGIEYILYGDDQPPPKECAEDYNRVIFKYLTSKFGRKWKKEVRPDVAGLKK